MTIKGNKKRGNERMRDNDNIENISRWRHRKKEKEMNKDMEKSLAAATSSRHLE